MEGRRSLYLLPKDCSISQATIDLTLTKRSMFHPCSAHSGLTLEKILRLTESNACLVALNAAL